MFNLIKGKTASEPSVLLNTRVDPYVRVVNGHLDEDAASSSPIVLQGRLDPSTLRFLKVDYEYQRPLEDRAEIYEALKKRAVVPNIEIGVRGQDFASDGDDFVIRSPAYIIDGWQRVGNIVRFMNDHPDIPVRVFGSIHFDTGPEWEEDRFHVLNKNRKRISPNLFLRNLKNKSDGVLTLYGLTNSDRTFPLYERVSWGQRLVADELISAMSLARTIRELHAHQAPLLSTDPNEVARTLDLAIEAISMNAFRRNVSAFYLTLNECWPFAGLQFRRTPPQLRTTFMRMVAKMLSQHFNFWNEAGTVLMVSADDKRKLGKFLLTDPNVANLAGAAGTANHILYEMLLHHMNSGRRVQKLEKRSISTRRR